MPQDRAGRTSTKSPPLCSFALTWLTHAPYPITEDGILIIDARRFRTQGRNRKDANDRLVELIRNAAQRPKIRRKTRPTLSSKIRRLESKRRGAESKRVRGPVHPDSE
jgi:ribosome-associated protein